MCSLIISTNTITYGSVVPIHIALSIGILYSKMARKTDYKPEYDVQARKLALLGLTDKEMASFFGCAKSTFRKWMVENPTFSDAVKSGKMVADADMAASLFKRGMGFEYTEVKTEGIVDEDTGRPVGKKITKTTKQLAPDTAAAFIWLKNRRPDLWRDKPSQGDDSSDLTEALKKIAEMLPG